jgi:D-xylose transport system substrate-binding protein
VGSATRTSPLLAAAGVAAVVALTISGCSSTSSGGSGSSGSSSSGGAGVQSGRIGLLLPETKTARYEAADRPFITQDVKNLCSACQIDYFNANQDSSLQQQQVNTAIAKGDKVLILDAVDYKSTPALIQTAKARGVKVLAYDRLANGGPDAYVSFDNQKVGALQAQSLLDALKGKTGELAWINGSPTDANAAQFKAGAHSVIPTGGVNGVTIGYETDTPDWSPDKAQTEMNSAIAKIGKDKVIGVYSANDGMGSGIFSAVQSAGINPLPPMTGQDAETEGVQRILAGQQYMTVYKAIKPEAQDAAQMAVDLLQGKPISLQTSEQTAADGAKVTSVLLQPVAVTKDQLKDTVFKDGFQTAATVCVGQYADACKAAGIS